MRNQSNVFFINLIFYYLYNLSLQINLTQLTHISKACEHQDHLLLDDLNRHFGFLAQIRMLIHHIITDSFLNA